MKKSKILVTGGSGFIGTNVVNYFLEKGYEVLNIDYQEPKDKSKKSLWRKIDIINFDDLEKVILDFSPEYIVHLAARCDLKGKTLDDYKANTVGVENIIRVCNENEFGLKKILITSSMLVCKPGYIPNDEKDYMPHTPYGESKVITEKITWNNSPKCDWAILRPTSIWGPWFDEPYRNFFDVIIKRQYVHIGHKSARMTYGYVENSVRQIEAILFSGKDKYDRKIFYLGDYEPTHLEEWADEIAGELKKKIIRIPYCVVKLGALFGDLLKKINIEFPLTSFRLKNMVTDNISNLDSTYEVIRELPYTRMEGVRRTLSWMKEHGEL